MTQSIHNENITTPVTVPDRTRRHSRLGRFGLPLAGGVVILHGAIHLLGAAKGFGWADVPALTQPISPVMGAAWLLAAVVMIVTGSLLLASVRWWWIVGAAATVLSQAVIVLDWSDAASGTVVNAVLAAAVIYAYSAHGPNSFESEYRSRTKHAMAPTASDRSNPSATDSEGPVLTEDDLDSLPALVAQYVRQSGALGRPHVGSFRALFHGRIRADVDKPWMEFTGEQVNTYGALPERFFKMDATMTHLPVDVLHVFAGDCATMRVKLCSLLPMVNASGPELTRAETVTLLNDLCILAPAALVTARIEWTPVDERQVRATFTRGDQRVTADLQFNDHGQLVDFTSDDRCAASPDGETLTRRRWSTPLRGYRTFHGRTISASGMACWHAPEPEGQFVYLEFEVDDVTDERVLSASSRDPDSQVPAADRSR